MLFFYITAIIIALLYFLQNKKLKRLRQFTEHIPGPKAYPFIGSSYAMTGYKDGLLKYLEHAQKKYGTVMQHWVGPYLYVHISDPADVEILLRDTKNIKKSSTYRLTKPWLGNGLITSTGEHWHSHRKIITPAFHFNILESFVDVFNEKGKILIKLLKNQAGKGQFDVFPLINLYALDAIMETSMGVTCNTQEHFNREYVKAIHDITKIIQTRSYSALMRINLYFKMSKLGKLSEQTLKVINGHCEKILNQRRDELKSETGVEFEDGDKKKRDAFLTLLLKGQQAGSGLTEQDIKDEVNNFIFGGHDTTSAAISFGLYHLSRNPDVQQKAYEEIAELFGETNIDLSLKDIQKTKYLDMVVKEILRLSPPIPVISRELEQDLKLSNVTLPKGCAVSVLIYMVHRNPEYFPNPEKFDPERFSPENVDKKTPYCFVPFSAGPRNCIGQKYALLEIKLTLIKILRNFIINPGNEEVKEKTFMTLTAENGINISLEERH